MMKIESYRDLIVWQKSMDLAVRCYRAAQALPKSEQQVLGYQLRKSSVSIPSNIAEGHSRHSTPHYIQRDTQEVGRMINGLVKSLERSERTRGR